LLIFTLKRSRGGRGHGSAAAAVATQILRATKEYH